jgi:hypothetical protein
LSHVKRRTLIEGVSVLRIILGPKRAEVGEQQIKPHNDELYNFVLSTNYYKVSQIKDDPMRKECVMCRRDDNYNFIFPILKSRNRQK